MQSTNTTTLDYFNVPTDVDQFLIMNGWIAVAKDTTWPDGSGYYSTSELSDQYLTWPEALAYQMFKLYSIKIT